MWRRERLATGAASGCVVDDGSAADPLSRRAARVLLVSTTSDFGGTENVVRELALRLERPRFETVVCSLCPPGRAALDVARSGVPVLSLSMSAQPRLHEMCAAVLRLARLVDEYRIDIVHAFLYRANTLARLATRIAQRRPLVISSQRSLVSFGPRGARLAQRFTARLADQMVAVSEAVRDELEQLEGRPARPIVVIGNGVDIERYAVGDRDAARRRLGLPLNRPLVGVVGRLAPEKGVATLLDSVAALRAHDCPVGLVIAGDGPQREALQQRAQALSLNGDAQFLGRCTDLPAVYTALDVFALPSLQEGSPNALLEAMACGRAPIASRVGGIPEIIEHGRSGWLVPPEAPGALAQALARLLTDPDYRLAMGREARRRVVTRFSIDSMVAAHARLYRVLLEEAYERCAR